jgi:DNA (cytosine-5)-methyltransferase 1
MMTMRSKLGRSVEDIRTERLKRRLSQKQLAAAVGVAPGILSKWERGLSIPSGSEFGALSRMFSCDAQALRKTQACYARQATPGEGYTTAKPNSDRQIFPRQEELVEGRARVLDLFCGAGGFSFGFEQTGFFQVAAGIDLLPDRVGSFRSNHRKATAILGDIRSIPIDELANAYDFPEVIIAGPPCQGFSSIRPFRTPTESDRRNSLMEHFILVVSVLNPDWCVFENVVGLLTHERGAPFKSLLSGLKWAGYSVDWRVLNAADYGLPQNRERLIIIGSRDGERFEWPIPTHLSEHRSMAGRTARQSLPAPLFSGPLKPAVTVMEAISDLPEVPAGGSAAEYADGLPVSEFARTLRGAGTKLTLHEATGHSAKMLRIIRLSGANRAHLPKDLTSSGFSSCYSRLEPNRPSVTLTVNFVHPSSNKCIHPFQDRALTPREGARLQGFPDDFVFCGTRAQIVKQIGNAVPPLLGRVIGESLMHAFERRGVITRLRQTRTRSKTLEYSR